MPRKLTKRSRSFKRSRPAAGRRRLQPALAGLGAKAAVAGAAYVGSKVVGGLMDRMSAARKAQLKRSRRKNALNKGINKASQGESYVPSHQCIIAKKGMSMDPFKDKLYNTLFPPRLFTYHSTQRLDVESGKQNILSWSFTTSSILDDPSQKIRDLLSNSYGFANPNPIETSGASGIEWNKVYLNYSSMLSTFYNSSTTTCEFDVYVYMTKKSVAEVIGAADGRNTNPPATWGRAETAADNYNDAQAFATVADSINTVGYKPTSAPVKYIMDRYWRLVDKESVVLMPGQSHKHYVRDQQPHILRQEDFNAFNNLEGVTYYVMVVAKGQVVTTNTAANTFITTGPCQLSVTIVAKNQFRVVPLQQTTSSLVTEFQQFTDAQVDVMNQYDREKHNYEEDA